MGQNRPRQPWPPQIAVFDAAAARPIHHPATTEQEAG